MTKIKNLGFYTHGEILYSQLERLLLESKEDIKNFINFSNAYQWHRYLWKLFPNRPDEKRGFLFRWDNRSEKSIIYLLSQWKPAILPEWGKWTTKEVLLPFQPGDFFSFQIRVNPVKVICPEGKQSSKRKRVPLLEKVQIISWFERKGIENGFRIIPEKIIVEKLSPIFCHKLPSVKSFHHNVNIMGTLQVTNEELFLQGIIEGIGKGKALGFGLLLLQPLPKSTLLSQGVL